MAEIRPFRALRYDAARFPLEKVLTQPYDKITPAMQDAYYAASPQNLIAVEKGRVLPGDSAADNAYTRAEKKIEEWIAAGVLAQDEAPAVYAYAQEFTIPGARTRGTRTGFIALGRVEDYQAKVVFRHERTLSAPKADRLELLRRTRLQTGQLFMLYEDPARQIDGVLSAAMQAPASAEMRDEYGVAHRLWAISDAARIREICSAMAAKKLVIADGHHRYETALNYRNECRAQRAVRNECRGESAGADGNAAPEFAMMTFVNTHAPGLAILPAHRLIRNVAGFDFEKFQRGLASMFDCHSYRFESVAQRPAAWAKFRGDFERPGAERGGIGAYAREGGGGAFHLLVLRRDADLAKSLPDVSEALRELDVILLHRLVLERGLGITAEAVAAEKNVFYEREMEAAIAAVDRGEAQLACLLNPARIEQVMRIALEGDVLPQKSTDFYPKLLSGIAMYRLENGSL